MYTRRHWSTDLSFLLRQHYNSGFLSRSVDILDIFQIILCFSFGILTTSHNFFSPILVTRLLRSLSVPTAVPTGVSRTTVETVIIWIVSVFWRSPSAVVRMGYFKFVTASHWCCRVLSGTTVSTRLAVIAGWASGTKRCQHFLEKQLSNCINSKIVFLQSPQ